eukprot:CAMPEP_0174851454 /NCGR_PEP_ID=MMETSP1114-20130205/23199_1 /TAXON_ID=312471 /ORGANISM="Neobodo designis, Strain CCAP 1951/1" /LENGTH=524 /DNA_ID=CAMNT_0016085993 /DNA_START=38 /DNA_END=1608 /DNA_ORIENTATION=-
MNSTHSTPQRTGALSSKIVGEVVRRVMLRQPTIGMSANEQQIIDTRVRQHLFKGAPFLDKDIERLVSEIVRARTPPAVQNDSQPLVHDGARSVTTSQSSQCHPRSQHEMRSEQSASRGRRSVAPSSSSSCVSEQSRRHGSSASVVSSRVDILRDRDRKALQQIAEICSLEAYTPPPKHTSLKQRAANDPWLKRALEEKAAAAAAAEEARKRKLQEQAKLREDLAIQMKNREAAVALEKQEDLREHEARVAQAEESLAAEEARKAEKRKEKEKERKEMALMQAESIRRKRETVVNERRADRAVAEAEIENHEEQLAKEQAERKRAIAALREVLLSEAEKRVREKQHERLQQLEYEYDLLREMSAQVEAERKRQEAARVQRVAAAREAIDVSRDIAAKKSQQQASEREKQDKTTIDGDREFVERERAHAREKRLRERQTQAFLKRQMNERQLADALARDADAEFINKAQLDEAEARVREMEEREVRREAQRQWRLFLTMQQRAKATRKTLDEGIPISISRPATNSP